MVEIVIKIEMTFLKQWTVGVMWSGEGGRQWWCGFNALFLARDGRRLDEALWEDEAETASSF
jgi:hypothetical protein